MDEFIDHIKAQTGVPYHWSGGTEPLSDLSPSVPLRAATPKPKGPDEALERWLVRQPPEVQWYWALSLAAIVGAVLLLLLLVWLVGVGR